MSKLFIKENLSLKEAFRLWFSSNKKQQKKNRQYEARIAAERQALFDSGVILIYGGVPFTEQDILDGKCPANGVLYNAGFRRLPGGKWRKATQEEKDSNE